MLDKMTGATLEVEIERGTSAPVNRLSVALAVCVAPPDGGITGTRAYLEIRDTMRADDTPVFSGWMFADSPALSAMDHPRYDVWVMSCTTSEGETFSASE